MKKRTFTTILFFGLLHTLIYSQNTSSTIWIKKDAKQFDREALRIPAIEFELYQLDMPALQEVLSDCIKKEELQNKSDYVEISIPLFGQKLQRFSLFETPVMEAELQAKYPEIRTYTGQGIDDPRQIIKLL